MDSPSGGGVRRPSHSSILSHAIGSITSTPGLYTGVSITLASIVLGVAASETNNFAELVAYLLNSPSRRWYGAVLINAAYVILYHLVLGARYALFGSLSALEKKNFRDRVHQFIFSKAVFVCLILRVRMDMITELLLWAGWYTIIGLFHLFTMLASDRFSWISSQPPSRNSKLVHTRLLALLAFNISASIGLTWCCFAYFAPSGISTVLLLVYECVMLLVQTSRVAIKYGLYLYDVMKEDTWEGLHVSTVHVEFISGLMMHALTMAHYLHILWNQGFAFSLEDIVLFFHLQMTAKRLHGIIQRFRHFRRVAQEMNDRYPWCTQEEIDQYDDDCAICLGAMSSAKKLPCGHVFHATCLRTWLEVNNSCPTCRRTLDPAPSSRGAPPGAHAHGVLGRVAPGGGDAAPAPAAMPRHTHGDGEASGPMEPPPHAPHVQSRTRRFTLFESGLLSWLPSVSVVYSTTNGGGGGPVRLRHPPRGLNAEAMSAMVSQVQEVLPHIPPSAIASDLRRTGNVQVTLSNLLEGYVPMDDPREELRGEGGDPPHPPAHDPSMGGASADDPGVADHEGWNTIARDGDAPTPYASSPASMDDGDGAAGRLRENGSEDGHHLDSSTTHGRDGDAHSSHHVPSFSSPWRATSEERQRELNDKKARLIAEARRRFLSRSSPAATTPRVHDEEDHGGDPSLHKEGESEDRRRREGHDDDDDDDDDGESRVVEEEGEEETPEMRRQRLFQAALRRMSELPD